MSETPRECYVLVSSTCNCRYCKRARELKCVFDKLRALSVPYELLEELYRMFCVLWNEITTLEFKKEATSETPQAV
jgi:hypothetical protein